MRDWQDTWNGTSADLWALSILPHRQLDDEGRTFTRDALGRNGPAMAFNYLPADRQPHTSPGVNVLDVKALERTKNAVQEIYVETGSVVFYDYPHTTVPRLLAVNLDLRRPSF